MISFITTSLSRIFKTTRSAFQSIFGLQNIDTQALTKLRNALIDADVGTKLADTLITQLSQEHTATGNQLHNALKQHLKTLLIARPLSQPTITLIVGVNGNGKTTTTAKLAYHLQQLGKRVLLVGADTFRAAAAEQLDTWATKYEIPAIIASTGEDPAACVYCACEQLKAGTYDALVIDTAGRLQSNVNLMKELEKISRVITKQTGITPTTLLVIDAQTGQNGLEQARIFSTHVPLAGVIVTKLDSSGKGGIIFAISDQLKLPVWYVGIGESIEDFAHFDAENFVSTILGE